MCYQCWPGSVFVLHSRKNEARHCGLCWLTKLMHCTRTGSPWQAKGPWLAPDSCSAAMYVRMFYSMMLSAWQQQKCAHEHEQCRAASGVTIHKTCAPRMQQPNSAYLLYTYHTLQHCWHMLTANTQLRFNSTHTAPSILLIHNDTLYQHSTQKHCDKEQVRARTHYPLDTRLPGTPAHHGGITCQTATLPTNLQARGCATLPAQ